jgi:uncharacterized NAD-dependent epimerase/dehydratase family protein
VGYCFPGSLSSLGGRIASTIGATHRLISTQRFGLATASQGLWVARVGEERVSKGATHNLKREARKVPGTDWCSIELERLRFEPRADWEFGEDPRF